LTPDDIPLLPSSKIDIAYASSTVAGWIKVGYGLTISPDGLLSTAGDYVTLDTDQIISGLKTFSTGIAVASAAAPAITTNRLYSVAGNLYWSGIQLGSPYALPIASPTVLGGIKIGNGMVIAGDGTVNVATATPVTRVIEIIRPSVGDDIPVLFATTASTLTRASMVLVGSTGGSVTLTLYKSTSRNSGDAGTACCPPVVCTSYTTVTTISLTVPQIVVGEFLYAVVSAVSTTPPVEVNLFIEIEESPTVPSAPGSGGTVTSILAPALMQASGSDTATLGLAWTGAGANFVLDNGTVVDTSTIATVSGLSSYLTAATAATTYLGISADAANALKLGGQLPAYYATSTSLSTYLTTAAATSTYATIASLSAYATTASLSAYATTASLSAYATTASLSAYATTASLSAYLTTATATSTYATTASLSAYLTTATATSTYATTASLAGYATTASLSAYATTASPTFTGTVTLPTGLSGVVLATAGVVSALSGTNLVLGNGTTIPQSTFMTAAPVITLTGAVTGSGSGSFATTLSAGSVGLSNMAVMDGNSVLGNNTGVSATPAALTVVQLQAMLDVLTATAASTEYVSSASPTFTGTVTFTGTTSGSPALSLPASVASNASANMAPGVAPTSPNNGDWWFTAAGVYAQVNGVTSTLSGDVGAKTYNIRNSTDGSLTATDFIVRYTGSTTVTFYLPLATGSNRVLGFIHAGTIGAALIMDAGTNGSTINTDTQAQLLLNTSNPVASIQIADVAPGVWNIL